MTNSPADEPRTAASDTPAANVPVGPSEPDWADQVTDLIVDTVDKVRDRTTGPILEITKGLVQAVVAVMILTPIVVVALAGTVRLLNWAIPGDVWIAYSIMGLALVLGGLALWSRRTPKT
ncbi:MAG: hypothetical protein ACKOYM_03850 [Actinomycetes bacterium]